MEFYEWKILTYLLVESSNNTFSRVDELINVILRKNNVTDSTCNSHCTLTLKWQIFFFHVWLII